MKLNTFFKENTGGYSMTRLITFIISLLVIFVVIYCLFNNIPIDFYGLSSILAVVITGKVVQRYREPHRNRIDNPDDPEI